MKIQDRLITLFINAQGEYHTNPELSFLREALQNGNQQEWEAGSGQAEMQWEKDGFTSSLVFTIADDDQCMLQYDTSKVTDHYYYSLGEGSQNNITIVSVGGDPWSIPSNLFIPKHQAIQAMEYFYQYGERSDAVNWISNRVVKWPEEV